MKVFAVFLSVLFLFTFAASDVAAQKRKITIILVRHAEKDMSDSENPNPQLTADGKLRAERFAKLVKKYKPMRVYSTNYTRTIDTATPIAKRRKLEIQMYDPSKLKDLAALILAAKKSRRFVIVGHNNTTPALANLLVGESKYKPLTETEYDKIFIIRIKKGKVRAKVIEY
jgi:2,3-bisphosphoglycerate-dependent phosphoglycerate mutase